MKKKGKKKGVKPKKLSKHTKHTKPRNKPTNRIRNNSGRNKTKKKENKKSKRSKKQVIHRYDNFLVTFTTIRTYEYNRPSELEVFNRSIPTVSKMTISGFRKRILPMIIEQELNTFNKITEDTNGAVNWSNWIYEVRAGDEDETHGRAIKGKIKQKKKKEDEEGEED